MLIKSIFVDKDRRDIPYNQAFNYPPPFLTIIIMCVLRMVAVSAVDEGGEGYRALGAGDADGLDVGCGRRAGEI